MKFHTLFFAIGLGLLTPHTLFSQGDSDSKNRKFTIVGVGEIENWEDIKDEEPVKNEGQSARRAAIFIFNHVGKDWNGHMRTLEDLVISEVVKLGFDVISREVSIDALKRFPGQDVGSGTRLDDALSNDSSALRLAQNLGASYLLYVSLSSFGETTKEIKAYGSHWIMHTHRLVLTYRITEGVAGGAVISDSVEVLDVQRKTKFARTTDGNMWDRMLYEGASKIGASLEDQLKTEQDRLSLEGLEDPVTFEVDVVLNGISFPEVRVNENGEFVLGDASFRIEAIGVDVILDGASLGSAPGAFIASPGFHRMRISRDGFKDWERMVNICKSDPPQKFSIDLEFDAEGLRRWKDKTAFVKQLKGEAIMTKAEAERLRSFAQFLRQSHLRVDIQGDAEDVKKKISDGLFQDLFDQDSNQNRSQNHNRKFDQSRF